MSIFANWVITSTTGTVATASPIVGVPLTQGTNDFGQVQAVGMQARFLRQAGERVARPAVVVEDLADHRRPASLEQLVRAARRRRGRRRRSLRIPDVT